MIDPANNPVAFVQDGGILAPGDPVTLTIDGNYTKVGGTLQIAIASSSDFDRLVVTSVANIGGTIQFDLIHGFVPHAGEVFNFLVVNQVTFNSTSLDFVITGLAPGFEFNVAFNSPGLGAERANGWRSDDSARAPAAGVVVMGVGIGADLASSAVARPTATKASIASASAESRRRQVVEQPLRAVVKHVQRAVADVAQVMDQFAGGGVPVQECGRGRLHHHGESRFRAQIERGLLRSGRTHRRERARE